MNHKGCNGKCDGSGWFWAVRGGSGQFWAVWGGSHPQGGDGGGVSDPAVLILQVVALRTLVPLTDLPQLHCLIWEETSHTDPHKHRHRHTQTHTHTDTHRVRLQTGTWVVRSALCCVPGGGASSQSGSELDTGQGRQALCVGEAGAAGSALQVHQEPSDSNIL